MSEVTREELVHSYFRVRQSLGYLGILLPLFLIVGGLLPLRQIEPSISDYYHTVLRDVFVGIMCAVAFFLITHGGGAFRTSPDDFVYRIAGFAAIGIAMFPNEGPQAAGISTLLQIILGKDAATTGHYLSAIIFFVSLAYLCIIKFPRFCDPLRGRIYRMCGVTIVAMTVLIIAASTVKVHGSGAAQRMVMDLRIVLWLEAIAIWAFCAAWLMKGRDELGLEPRRWWPRSNQQIAAPAE